KWVISKLEKKGIKEVEIFNGYELNAIEPKSDLRNTTIIFGLEKMIQNFGENEKPRETFLYWLERWLKWEKEKEERNLYLIGTDIGKGIVPMEKELRVYRDIVGYCFQDVVKKAERVDVIWYGIN